MNSQDALEHICQLLAPRELNYLQKSVLARAWDGLSYQEIATEVSYDSDYVKEIGARLWEMISEAVGVKVSKKNVKLILEDLRDLQIHAQAELTGDRASLNPSYSPPIPPFTAIPTNLSSSIPSNVPLGVPNNLSADDSSNIPTSIPISRNANASEFPSGPVPLESGFYVPRAPVETEACREVAKAGSLIRIKAPHQWGKTSLVYRILAHAKTLGFRTALLDLQEPEHSILSDLNRFLRWFCFSLSQRLGVEPKLNDYWDDEMGSKLSCTIYFKEYLLPSLNGQVAIALDEVNHIFEYPTLARDFFPLLRSWHEEAAYTEAWQRVRWVISHSTEVYVPLNINQSPFNVGLPIELEGFTLAQVQLLAQQYDLAASLSVSELQALIDLTNGHPQLIRLAFYWLSYQKLTLEQLLQEAATQSGIYRNHLRWYWEMLQQQPELWQVFQKIVESPDQMRIDAIAAYRLESLGLIELKGNQARPSCELYRQYFSAQ